MCPHCVAAAIGAVAISIPALGYLKSKFSRRSIRQDAARENFNQLYGAPINPERANPGYVSFQKSMGEDHASR